MKYFNKIFFLISVFFLTVFSILGMENRFQYVKDGTYEITSLSSLCYLDNMGKIEGEDFVKLNNCDNEHRKSWEIKFLDMDIKNSNIKNVYIIKSTQGNYYLNSDYKRGGVIFITEEDNINKTFYWKIEKINDFYRLRPHHSSLNYLNGRSKKGHFAIITDKNDKHDDYDDKCYLWKLTEINQS